MICFFFVESDQSIENTENFEIMMIWYFKCYNNSIVHLTLIVCKLFCWLRMLNANNSNAITNHKENIDVKRII